MRRRVWVLVPLIVADLAVGAKAASETHSVDVPPEAAVQVNLPPVIPESFEAVVAVIDTTTTTTTIPPTTTTTAAPTTTTTRAPAPPPPPAVHTGADPNDPATWDALAQCESGQNWAANTGNGYYGGLQFSAGTWRSVGGQGLPHQNSREEQIHRAQILQARSGWGQWPACTRKLHYR